MRPELREFLEQETVGAARSKAIKKAKREKRRLDFERYLAEIAINLEANGNPAAAANFRKFWGKFERYRSVFK